jgi:hypothetical protein
VHNVYVGLNVSMYVYMYVHSNKNAASFVSSENIFLQLGEDLGGE